MGLTSARNTPFQGRKHPFNPQPVEANTSLYVGGLVALNGNGNAVPAQVLGSSPLNQLTVVGICGGIPYFHGQNAINTAGVLIPGTTLAAGAAGAILTEIWRGVCLLDIGSASITQAQMGLVVYTVDDHTVHATDGSGTRVAAGTLVGLENGMAWVDLTRQSVPTT